MTKENVAVLEANGTASKVEVWVPAQCDGIEYPLYEVSDQGRVRKVAYSVMYWRDNKRVITSYKERLLTLKDNGSGYLQVALASLKPGDKTKYLMVSRLVLGSFEPLYNASLTDVDHINSIKGDNRLVNLRRLSHRDNLVQPHRMKYFRKPIIATLPTGYQVEFESITEVANYFALTNKTVRDHLNSKKPTKTGISFVLKK